MEPIPDINAQKALVDRYVRQWNEELQEPGLSARDAASIVEHIGLFRGIKENLMRFESMLGSAAADSEARRRRILTLLRQTPMTTTSLAAELQCSVDVVRTLLRPMVAGGQVSRDGIMLAAR